MITISALKSTGRRATSVALAMGLLLGGLGAVAGASVAGKPLPPEQAGTVLTWGGNATLKGHEETIGEPAATAGEDVVGIWGQTEYVLALTADGELAGWGNSGRAAIWQSIPSDLGEIDSISAGAFVAIAIRTDGTVRAWGDNSQGGLNVPDGLSDVAKVSAGQHIVAALLEDGTVRVWGNSLAGATTVPSGLSDVVDVAAGNDTVHAVKADGTVVSWGANNNNQTDIPEAVQGDAQRVFATSTGAGVVRNDGRSIHRWGTGFSAETVDLGEPIVDVSMGTSEAWVIGTSGTLRQVRHAQNFSTEVSQTAGERVEAAYRGSSRNIAIVSDEPIDNELSVVSDPVVEGSVIVGQTVTLVPAEFSAEPDEVSTEWLVDGEPVTGAGVTPTSLRINQGWAGSMIQARQTAVLGDEEAVATSAEVGPVQQVLAGLGRPTIAGDPVVGATLSVTADAPWSTAPDEVSTQWFADGEPIDGATGETFTVTDAQIGAEVTARQTATLGEQTADSLVSTPIGPITEDTSFRVVSDPVVEGSVIVGQTVTLVPAEFSAEPDEVSTEWLVDGEPVTGAGVTPTSLRINQGWAGSMIQARQTAVLGDEEAVATSAEVGPVQQVLAGLGRPTIAGDPVVGATLSVTADAPWSTAPDEVSTQWFADGEPIDGATGETFTVTDAQIGAEVTARQTATLGEQTADSLVSTPIGPIEAPPLAVVSEATISGTPQVGQTLTGTPATFNDPDADVANQWLADDEPIAGATGTALELAEEHEGAQITFRSTGTRADQDPVVSTSEPVGPVQRADVPIELVTDASIEGTPMAGETLTGTPAEFSGDVDEVTNQWLADGEPISGATGTTLELTDDHAGAMIAFRSTATRGDSSLVSTSDAVGPVLATLAATSPPTISGTAAVGETLTGTPAEFSGDPEAVRHEWRADGEAIDGQTGLSLQLAEEHEGARITFASIATRGSESVESVSEATAAVAPEGEDPGGPGGPGGPGDPEEPSEDKEGAIQVLGDGPFRPGDTLDVMVGEDYAGDEVGVWLFSTPRNLGTFTVADDGTIRVALPYDVEPGEHRLAVYDADGQLIGWDAITIVGDTVGGPGPGGALGAVLPNAGSPASVALWAIGVAMILAGSVLLLPMLRRRSAG